MVAPGYGRLAGEGRVATYLAENLKHQQAERRHHSLLEWKRGSVSDPVDEGWEDLQ